MQHKLIVCLGALQHGGAERVLSVLSYKFADKFDEVEYVLWLDWRFPGVFYDIDKRIKIIRISEVTHSTNVFKHMVWFRKHVSCYRPTSILSFFEMINLCVITSLIGRRNNIIVSERNDPYFFQHGRFYRKLINFAYRSTSVHKIIMQTKHNKDYFYNNKLLYNKTDIVYNPISMSIDMIGSAIDSRKENVIISAARLEPQKKQVVLIEAFALFHRTHPAYKLRIFGEGSCREELNKLIEKYKLNDNVELPGNSKAIWEEMKRAKLFVISSEYEGMSNSMLEAMVLGLPCISTKVSGATDLIKDGYNGFLVEQNDVKTLAEKMTLLVDNEKLLKTMGNNATEVYDILKCDVIAQKWINYLY